MSGADDLFPHPEIARVARLSRPAATPCGAGAMHWWRWGDAPGRPLVLLHGGYGSWGHWLRNVEALSARRTVWACDLPGLGASADPPAPHAPPGLAAIVAAGLQALLPPGTACDLAGFSFGGVLAGCIAQQQPQLVRRLVLVGAAGMGLTRAPAPGEQRRVPAEAGPAEAEAIHRRNLELLMFADPAKVDPVALALQAWNIPRARVRSRPLSRGDWLRRALEAARPDVAGIWGELDVTAHPHLDERRALLAAVRPGGRFEVLPGVGHWVAYEGASRFNAVLEEVLA